MKKTLFLLFSLVATTAAFSKDAKPNAPAETRSLVRLVATTDQKLKLFVQPQATSAQIQLTDQANHLLYSSAHFDLRQGLSQQFDISALAVGTYQLTITENGQVITKTFVVQPRPESTFVVLVA